MRACAGCTCGSGRWDRLRVFGPPEELGLDGVDGIEVVPTSEWIGNDEDPVAAVRAKKEASVVRAAADVAEGRSAAMVSPGSTGATMAAATFGLRRLKGVQRPALAVQLPVPGKPVLFLDVGANVEVRAQHLVQFAFLGAAFSEAVLGVERPRVGLLSVGEEAGKGREEVVAAHDVLAGATGIDFVGNVEGRDLPGGAADVVVTDGFTGNVSLKLMEGTAKAVTGAIRDAARSNPLAALGGLLMRPALGGLRRELHPDTHRRRDPARTARHRRRRPRQLRRRGDRQRDPARRTLRRGRRGRAHGGAAARAVAPAAARSQIVTRRTARDRKPAMSREEVLTLVRNHLAEELELDAAKIGEASRFKEDLDADSLDLYELVMELEDTYGISVSEEQAAKIATVGDAVDFVLEHAPA